MEVVKYCKEEHNLLKNCNSIHLGTYSYFRKNYKGEGDLISDVKEGRGRIIFQDNVFDNIDLVPESYIFCTCMKLLDSEDVQEHFHEDYNDFYVITSIEAFAELICRNLANNLTIYDIKENYRKHILKFNINQLQQLRLGYILDRVQYMKDKSTRINNLTELLKFTNFSKDERYASQLEHRCVYYLYHPELGPVPVNPAPKILDLRLHTHYLNKNLAPSQIFEKNIIIGCGK